METRLQLSELMHAIAAEAGAEVEEDGIHLVLPYDEIHECRVSVSEDGERIGFSAPLCRVRDNPERMFESALALCLHAARTRGASICLHENPEALVLHSAQPVGRLNQDWLSTTLAQFIDTARALRHELTANDAPRSAPALAVASGISILWP
jgi:hypothetical protein